MNRASEPVDDKHRARMDKHILIAEDNPISRRILEEVLKKAGYQIQSASDGLTALELASHYSFDLILMDIQMPGMDGLTASLNLRERGYYQPIVALSASLTHEVRTQTHAAKMSGALNKGMIDDELIAALDQWIFSDRKGDHILKGPDQPNADASPTAEKLSADAILPEALVRLRKLEVDSQIPVLARLYVMYREASRQFLEQLKLKVPNRDGDCIAKLAHAFKSSSHNLGAQYVVKLCQDLEEKKISAAEWPTVFVQLKTEIQKAEAEFARAIAKQEN